MTHQPITAKKYNLKDINEVVYPYTFETLSATEKYIHLKQDWRVIMKKERRILRRFLNNKDSKIEKFDENGLKTTRDLAGRKRLSIINRIIEIDKHLKV